MALILVVKEQFGTYAKGDQITDPEVVEFVLASEDARHVIKAEGEEE